MSTCSECTCHEREPEFPTVSKHSPVCPREIAWHTCFCGQPATNCTPHRYRSSPERLDCDLCRIDYWCETHRRQSEAVYDPLLRVE